MSRRVVTPENLSTDFLVDAAAATPVTINLDETQFEREAGTGKIQFIGATGYVTFVSAAIALSTVAAVVFQPNDAGAVWELTIALDDGSGVTRATITGHATTPTITGQIGSGTAILLTVTGTNIRAALGSGAAAAHYTAVRII